MALDSLLEKFKLPLILVLLGLILLGFGVLAYRLPSGEPKVEVISSDTAVGSIVVDIEGAVQKPGVYELQNGARANDLLIKAGGLSAGADRDWVSKNLNLAQKLVDGAKIFVPESGGSIAGASAANTININTAGVSQLDSLWGIGEKRASDIIAGRPYQTTDELVSKAKIPQNVYDRIKDLVTCY